MFVSAKYQKGALTGIDWTYVTTEPAVFVFDLPHSSIPCSFRNDWLLLERTYDGARETVTAVVSLAYAWDGCSVVPDFEGTLAASLIHDPIYQFVTEICEAFGWSSWRVLKFADARFSDVMAYNKVNIILRGAYYAGVSVFGWPYNRIAKLWRSWTS